MWLGDIISYKHCEDYQKQRSNNTKYYKVVVESNTSQGVLNHVQVYWWLKKDPRKLFNEIYEQDTN